MPEDTLCFLNDGRVLRNECMFDTGKQGSSATGCSKDYGRRTDRKTWGTQQVCCQHGVLYAMMIIETAEGPRDVASFLVRYVRDLGQQPLSIVYDNACAAMEYFENRYPKLSTMITWSLDRYGWPVPQR